MGKARPAVYVCLRPKSGGLAGLLAEAPAVSAAFGRWPGFILMMTAILGVFALSVFTILVATKEARYLVLPL